MKSAGIVRRIDDLGRVVIPKEIRKTNKWDAGTPMEIFITENGVVFREYKALENEKNAVTALQSILEKTNDKETYDAARTALEFIENY